MTEEPYRWLEAWPIAANTFATTQRRHRPCLPPVCRTAFFLLGVGGGQSKVFELFDRHALAGLGHPADIEKIRQAAIDAAHWRPLPEPRKT